jgi:hypothetical protein
MRYRRLAAGVATATAIMAVVLGAGAGSAGATVKDFPNSILSRNVTISGTTATVYAVRDSSHKASYATVLAGTLHVQARAQCQRANGGTSWYESTIRAGRTSTSHYDCDNNGTYNRAIVGLGVDIN